MAKKTLPILFTFFLGFSCTHVFYQPTKGNIGNLEKYSPTNLKNIYFKSLDQKTKLHGWLFKTKQEPKKGLVIQFHGNAENIWTHSASMLWFLKYGYDVFTFDYRGYGFSQGKANVKGIQEDALAALKKAWELSGKKDRALVVYGQSLGGITALEALTRFESKKAIHKIIIESSFSSYRKMAMDVLSRHWLTWIFQPLCYVLISDRYSPKKNLDKISPIPLLVLHGRKDKIVPPKHGQAIFKLAHEPKCYWEVPKGGHINLMQIEQGKNRKQLIQFLEDSSAIIKCP